MSDELNVEDNREAKAAKIYPHVLPRIDNDNYQAELVETAENGKLDLSSKTALMHFKDNLTHCELQAVTFRSITVDNWHLNTNQSIGKKRHVSIRHAFYGLIILLIVGFL